MFRQLQQPEHEFVGVESEESISEFVVYSGMLPTSSVELFDIIFWHLLVE
jgi:hypothetical protein